MSRFALLAVVLAGCRPPAEPTPAQPPASQPVAKVEQAKQVQSANTAKSVATAYFLANTVDGMLAFVADPDRVAPLMRQRQMGAKLFRPTTVVAESEDDMGDGWKWVVVRYEGSDGRGGTSSVYLREKGAEWKVAWPESVGYNETPLKTMLASPPADDVSLRVQCELCDIYLGSFANSQSTHYCVLIEEAHPFALEHAYVQKDSPDGRRLFDRLRDGRHHQFTLRLQFASDDAKSVAITGVVSNNWIVR